MIHYTSPGRIYQLFIAGLSLVEIENALEDQAVEMIDVEDLLRKHLRRLARKKRKP